jgi:hypothetical protein
MQIIKIHQAGERTLYKKSEKLDELNFLKEQKTRVNVFTKNFYDEEIPSQSPSKSSTISLLKPKSHNSSNSLAERRKKLGGLSSLSGSRSADSESA